jgi:hypothetical protein
MAHIMLFSDKQLQLFLPFTNIILFLRNVINCVTGWHSQTTIVMYHFVFCVASSIVLLHHDCQRRPIRMGSRSNLTSLYDHRIGKKTLFHISTLGWMNYGTKFEINRDKVRN